MNLARDLPEGIRLYTAGAVDFHRDNKLACAEKGYGNRRHAPEITVQRMRRQ
jgi:hypothetical protein